MHTAWLLCLLHIVATLVEGDEGRQVNFMQFGYACYVDSLCNLEVVGNDYKQLAKVLCVQDHFLLVHMFVMCNCL